MINPLSVVLDLPRRDVAVEDAATRPATSPPLQSARLGQMFDQSTQLEIDQRRLEQALREGRLANCD